MQETSLHGGTLQPEHAPHLVEQFRMFGALLPAPPAVVYSPCCNILVAPSDAFPDSRSIYADKAKALMQMLRLHGYEAHAGTIPEFRPDTRADLMILLNPQIRHELVADDVRLNGHVIANNYHQTADYLHQDARFRLDAILNFGSPPTMIRGGFEQYFSYVETDEEFVTAHSQRYAEAVDTLEKLPRTPGAPLINDYSALTLPQREPGQIHGYIWLKGKLLGLPPTKKTGELFLFERMK